MGLSGIGIQELLLIGLIVVLVFGTKNLRNVGGAVRDFKRALSGQNENSAHMEMPGLNEQKPASPDNKSSS